jgi:uncharacterized repeat protein (TIGR01451 family)
MPEEYAIGFAGTYRNTDGGVALGYGYGPDGMINTGSCDAALWTTGQNLRNNPALRSQLEPGGPLLVNGLQGNPIDAVRPANEPPATSYFVDYDERFDDPRASGHMGSVRILARPCAGQVAGSGQPGGYSSSSPPYVSGPQTPNTTTTPSDCLAGQNPDGTCGPIRIDLAIKKTSSEGKYDSASGTWTFQFTLSVANVGNPFFAQNHIAINDPVPAGLTFTAAAGSNWNCPAGQFPATNPNALNCTYNFGAGQIATGTALAPLVITVTVKSAGKYENCATTGIRGAPWLQETTQANNKDCATIVVPVDLAIKKTAGESKFDPVAGTWSYQYTLTVTNVGAAISPASPNVIAVSDPVPGGLTFTSATGSSWTCNAPPALSAGTLTCAYTGTGTVAHNLPLGTITVTVVTKTPGKHDNCATVGVTAASGLQETTQANNKDCVTIEITKPVVDLAIKKTVGEVKYDAATGLWTFTYTLDVSNAGNPFAPQGYIAINDPVPGGLTFTSATGSNWACNAPPALSAGTLNCSYNFGSGLFNNSVHLNPLVITVTTKTPGKYDNCATVGIAPASGFQETTLANNKACVPIEIKSNGDPVHPPPLNPQCGVNVIFVVDASASVAPYAWQFTSALTSAGALFNTHGSKAAVIHFSDIAQQILPMSTATYSSITSQYNPSSQQPAGSGPYYSGGSTNWEAALLAAVPLAANQPVIAVFITDGDPTSYLDSSGNYQATTNTALAISEASAAVAQLYGLNVPVIGIGIGPSVAQANIQTLLGAGAPIHTGGYGDLTGILNSLAQQMCPDLYLTKQISPSYIDVSGTGPFTATITLKVTNYTTGTLNNIAVQDSLPDAPPGSTLLTNPVNPVASTGFPTTTGNIVNWTIPSLLAGQTATLAFTVTVTPPTPALAVGGMQCKANFAQVTAVQQTINSTPNNMANPKTGPVAEHDEASAQVCVYNPSHDTCTTPYLWVTKTTPSEVCKPDSASPCKFTVTVTAQCTAFNGPVLFGDGIFSGSAPATATIASITNNANPAICAWSSGWSSTTSPTSCQANISLPVNQSITFTVTLASPLAAGNYRNCFVADGKTPLQTTFSGAYTDVNPPTSANGAMWGDCVQFIVPGAKPIAPQCDPTTTIKRRNECVCRFPNMVKGTDGACVCPTPMNFVPGRGCVPPLVCPPPKIPNAANTACVCPEGTLPQGRECVKPPVCQPPLVPGPAVGQCICPPGTVQSGKECVKPHTCTPPMIPGPTDQCICPPGTVKKGNECVKQETCKPPMVQGPAAGQCICPPGMVQQGGRCVPRIECRSPLIPNAVGTDCVCRPGLVQKGRNCVEPVVCNPPARLNRDGACQCPRDMVAKGNSCVERERPPTVAPGVPPRGRDIEPPRGGGRDTDPRGGGRGNDPPRGGGRDNDPPRGGQGVDLPGRR